MRQNQNQAFYMKRQFIWDVAFCSQKAQTKQFSSCVEGVGRWVRGWVGSHCKEQIPPIKCKKAYPTICTFLLKLQLFNWATSTSQKIPEIMSVSSSPFFVCLFVSPDLKLLLLLGVQTYFPHSTVMLSFGLNSVWTIFFASSAMHPQ